MNVDILSTRKTSGFPVSIGTGLALETIFEPIQEVYDDPNRKYADKKDPDTFNELWFNLATLLRNIYSSISSEDLMLVKPEHVGEVLMHEVEVLHRIATDQSHLKCGFYLSKYDDLTTLSAEAILRLQSSDLQRRHAYLDQTILGRVLAKKLVTGLKVFKNRVIPQERSRVVVMTHAAYDLTEHAKFGSLELLESNTGIIKGPERFYTKFYNGKEFPTVPFNRLSLVIMGDKEHFRPQPIKVKQAYVDISVKNHWTQLTGRDKILADIEASHLFTLIKMAKNIAW